MRVDLLPQPINLDVYLGAVECGEGDDKDAAIAWSDGSFCSGSGAWAASSSVSYGGRMIHADAWGDHGSDSYQAEIIGVWMSLIIIAFLGARESYIYTDHAGIARTLHASSPPKKPYQPLIAEMWRVLRGLPRAHVVHASRTDRQMQAVHSRAKTRMGAVRATGEA